MGKLTIWGAGGHARVVADAVRARGLDEVVGFLVEQGFDTRAAAVRLLGGIEQLATLRAEGFIDTFVAIGDGAARRRIGTLLEAEGFALATIIHPGAAIAHDARIEAGAFVGAAAVVGSGAVVRRLAIVNTGAIVDHDCSVGEASHVCPGATVAGRVAIGDAAWIGAGATIIDGVSIGAAAYVGAGAVVIGNVESGRKVAGVPARDIGPAGVAG